MRRKIKKMDCIEYLSVQAPLEKVNMLEDKQSKYIHEFVKRKEYSIVGKIRRNGFSQRDVDRQWNQIVNMIRKKQISGIVVANMAAISSSVADAYFKVGLVIEAGGIVGDIVLGQHLAHIGAAGGVADERRTVADEGDGLVPGHLQTLHQAQCHEVTDMQRVRRAVKANVERGFAVVDHVFDLFLIGHLRDQAAGDQFIIQYPVDPIVDSLVHITLLNILEFVWLCLSPAYQSYYDRNNKSGKYHSCIDQEHPKSQIIRDQRDQSVIP